MFIPFDPQPPHAEVPTVFPSPFQPDPPGALATRAMRETRAFLEEHPVFSPDRCRGRFGGKMHGVLVVEHAVRSAHEVEDAVLHRRQHVDEGGRNEVDFVIRCVGWML